MIRKTLLALAVAGAAALAVPSFAAAEVYMSESSTEHAVTERYGSECPGAACRPQGLARS